MGLKDSVFTSPDALRLLYRNPRNPLRDLADDDKNLQSLTAPPPTQPPNVLVGGGGTPIKGDDGSLGGGGGGGGPLPED